MLSSNISIWRAASFFLLLFPLAVAGGDEPTAVKTDLFQAGTEGYALYRIPGIVITARGTVLVYCEARKDSPRDWGHIDLVYRRSTDGGKSFAQVKPLVEMDARKWDLKRNPAAVAQKLGLSVKTVDAHRERIKEKLGLKSGNELLRYAVSYNMDRLGE